MNAKRPWAIQFYPKLVELKWYNEICLAMKVLACGNTGFNCDAVIRGDTEDETYERDR